MEDTNNVGGNPNTNYAADKLRARHDFPTFTRRSLGHRMCSKWHCGRVPRETFRHGRGPPPPGKGEKVHAAGATQTCVQGQAARPMASPDGPGLTCPRTFLNDSITSRLLCSVLPPISRLGSYSGDKGNWAWLFLVVGNTG